MVITMTNTGCKKYLENAELLLKLGEKLPMNSKRPWALEEIKIKHANLKIFSDWLENEVKLLMSVNFPPQINIIHKYPIHKKVRIVNVVNTQRAICKLCGNGSHIIEFCNVFLEMTVENMRNYDQKNGLCFKCSVPGYTVKNKFWKIVCNIGECRDRYDRLVHIDVERADKTNEHSKAGDRTDKNSEHSETGDFHFSGFVGNQYSALLKIVKVKLYGQEKNIETYALLDE
ncbi:hypothetical protein JTB14_031907 [Gonioctena quinquepunctata]|nr:hypothetical protein JTB14_031907 [Gonioctena quinquepunctata]